MKRHLSNAFYGAVDYSSYPLGMLLIAPIVLRSLGAAEYGLWMVATSVISAGSIIASGFCDAGIQRVAKLRGASQHARLTQTFQVLLAINLTLGFALALLVWIAAPWLAHDLAGKGIVPLHECLICLRIASALILVRTIEAVSVSVQRAFEAYSGTVQISTAVRLVTLGLAAVVALCGGRTQSIMLTTALVMGVGVVFQFRFLRRFLADSRVRPAFHHQETALLIRTGSFVWLQAAGSVSFRQLDRILLGASLGAALVGPYALCIQLAEPLFGLTASGLSFFFPYLSGRAATLSTQGLRRTVLRVFVCNLALVLCGAALLLHFGDAFMAKWVGPVMAHSAAPVLPLIVIGSALSGLSVTGTYAMQALGLFREVAVISLGCRAVLLMMMLYLLHHHGLYGMAVARMCYGAAALLVYLPLLHRLRSSWTKEHSFLSVAIGPHASGRGGKMRVLLAAAQFSSSISGLQRHALNAVRCLLTQPVVEEIHLVVAPWQQPLICDAGFQNVERVHTHIAAMRKGMLSRNLWYYRSLPRLVAKLQPDIVHLTYPVPVNAAAIEQPIVLTLHDLYPYEIPDNFGFPKVLFNRAILQQCLHAADSVACVSETTRHRLGQYATRACIEKSLRIYNCVEAESDCATESPIPGWGGEPYLLSVSQHRRNKNLPLLVRAFHRLLHEHQVHRHMRLVVVGICGPETSRIYKLISELSLQKRAVFLEGLSEPQLQWCYRNCEAVVAPSETEGFGLPVAEALLAGSRVICSDIPAFREIDEHNCHFVTLGMGEEERLAAAIAESLRQPAPAPVELPQFSAVQIGAAYAGLYSRLLVQRTASSGKRSHVILSVRKIEARAPEVNARVLLAEEKERV